MSRRTSEGTDRGRHSLPWAKWTYQAPGSHVMVYTDASRQETPRGMHTCAGLVVQLADTPWGVAVPLPPEMDHPTAQMLALARGRWIVECLSNLGAVAGEVVYHTQAAEALAAGATPHQ